MHRMQRSTRQRQNQFAQRRQILLLILRRIVRRRIDALHDVGDAEKAVPNAFTGDDDFGGIERPAGEIRLMDGTQTGR